MKLRKVRRKKEYMKDSEQIQTESPHMQVEKAPRISDASQKYTLKEEISMIKKSLEDPRLINLLSTPNIRQMQLQSATDLLPKPEEKEEEIQTPQNDCFPITSTLVSNRHKSPSDIHKSRECAILPNTSNALSATTSKFALAPLYTDRDTEQFSQSCANFYSDKRKWKYSDYGPIQLPFSLGTYQEYKCNISNKKNNEFLRTYRLSKPNRSEKLRHKLTIPLQQLCHEVISQKYGTTRNRNVIPNRQIKSQSIYQTTLAKVNNFINNKALQIDECVNSIRKQQLNCQRKYNYMPPLLLSKMNGPPLNNSHIYKIVIF